MKKYLLCLSVIGLSAVSSFGSDKLVDGQNRQVLLLEFTPAMCALYPSRAYSNQCLNNYRLTSEGLDLGYRCLSSTTPILSPVQNKVLNRIMPDAQFIDQAWRRYGACSPYSASHYFRQIYNLATKLNVPLKISSHSSFMISKDLFIEDMQAENLDMPADSLALTCENNALSQPVLTKMKVCYSGSDFAACPVEPDTCGNDFIVWGTP